MSSYSEIRNVILSAKNTIVNIAQELGKAIGNYIANSPTVSEEDIYNMVKDLPQDIQIKALCKALVCVNAKTSKSKPSYLQNDKSGRRSII